MNVQNFLSTDNLQRNRWWHWVLGVVFIIASWILLSICIYLFGISPLISSGDYSKIAEHTALLISFLPLILGLWLTVRFWHKDAFIKIFTAASHFRWGYFWRAALIVGLASAILTGLNYLIAPDDFKDYKINSDLSLYWKLLIVTLIFVPFQAASEELFLRGYLNRALSGYIKNPWIIFLITSASFAALHAWNPEAAGQLWPYLTLIFMFGFFMCVILYFEGGLESAISYHIMNNLIVFGLLGYSDPDLPDSALYVSDIPDVIWTDAFWAGLSMSITCATIIWANRKWGRDFVIA